MVDRGRMKRGVNGRLGARAGTQEPLFCWVLILRIAPPFFSAEWQPARKRKTFSGWLTWQSEERLLGYPGTGQEKV